MLGAACLLLAGCGDGPPRRIAVLGDSITNMVADDLRSAAPHRWRVAATDGATAAEMLPEALGLSAARPHQAVVALGTNDVLRQVPWARTRDALRRAVGAFPAARCVHLVTVSTALPSFGRTPPASTAARRINDWIRRTAADDQRVRVVEWAGYVDEVGTGAALRRDRIHPTEDSQAELATLVLDSIKDC